MLENIYSESVSLFEKIKYNELTYIGNTLAANLKKLHETKNRRLHYIIENNLDAIKRHKMHVCTHTLSISSIIEKYNIHDNEEIKYLTHYYDNELDCFNPQDVKLLQTLDVVRSYIYRSYKFTPQEINYIEKQV